MPSWMRAPPESFRPTDGQPFLSAMSMTLQILLDMVRLKLPPNTVKSWA